jgi:hypothetical protein
MKVDTWAEATHEIEEWDRDYRAYCGAEYYHFDSDEEANAYARSISWTGYDYYAKKIVRKEPTPYDGYW